MKEKVTRKIELTANQIEKILQEALDLSPVADFKFEIGQFAQGQMDQGPPMHKFTKLVITEEIPFDEMKRPY